MRTDLLSDTWAFLDGIRLLILVMQAERPPPAP